MMRIPFRQLFRVFLPGCIGFGDFHRVAIGDGVGDVEFGLPALCMRVVDDDRCQTFANRVQGLVMGGTMRSISLGHNE